MKNPTKPRANGFSFACVYLKKEINRLPFSAPPRSSAFFLDDIVVIIAIDNEVARLDIQQQLKALGIKYIYTSAMFHLTNTLMRYDGNLSRKRHELSTFSLIKDNSEKIRQVQELLADKKSRHVYDAIVKKTQYNLVDFNDINDGAGTAYFIDGIFTYEKNEIFVDGGAYHGEDTLRFSQVVGDKFRHSYCFESDWINYHKCVGNLSKRLGSASANCSETCYRSGKVSVYNSGLHNLNENLSFDSYGTPGSAFSQPRNPQAGATASAVRLEDIVNPDERITFIKLDIEGAEIAALQGAERIIKKDRPKLAICIYHEIEDLWTIPLFIHNTAPEYKLYVRHHWANYWESVLYATL